MQSPDLKNEILKEIARKAYELQIKAGLAQNAKIGLPELLAMEKALHHEIKRLRKLIGRYEQAEKKKKLEELEQLISAELNHGIN
jgi:hypothetical protein